MEHKLELKQKLSIKPAYNSVMEQSLAVLGMNAMALRSYIMETHNPYLSVHWTGDPYMEPTSYITRPEKLSDVIMSQVHLMKKPLDILLCEYLLSRLDSNGYIKDTLDELVQHSLYTHQEIVKALDVLSRLEPVGCFCFSLKDSLRVQCEESEEAPSETGYILCDYLEEIAKHDYSSIKDQTGLEQDEIIEGVEFIRTLHPKPAANYAADASWLMPEARVRVNENKITVELLGQDLLLEVSDFPSQSEEMNRLRQQAHCLVYAVQKRNLTLIQILQALCNIQRDHFILGKPVRYCTLEDVSKQCHLHISTVSRAIASKSFEFENHYYPIRSLLCHQGNREYDMITIQKQIKEWIDAEDPCHPLSDSRIQKLLVKQGVNIARRTVTKYREAYQIPTSSQRKKTK